MQNCTRKFASIYDPGRVRLGGMIYSQPGFEEGILAKE